MSRNQDALLVAARSFDPNFVGHRRGYQARCEAAYLRFVAQNPDDELAPYIYSHLGHLYSDWAGGEQAEKSKFERDEAKARGYFEQAVRVHPPGKVSDLLIGARANAASLTAAPQEKVARYLELYNDLDRLKSDEVGRDYWLTAGQGDATIDAFWNLRSAVMKAIKVNTVVAAASAKQDPLGLLDEVSQSVADEEFTTQAKEMRRTLAKRNPWLERDAATARRERLWSIIIGVAALIGGGAAIWIVTGNARKRAVRL